MKTTLFKGFSKETKKWIEGDLITDNGKYFIYTHENSFANTKYGGYYHIDDSTILEVYPDSISQYTNVDDKNKKKIFGSIWINNKLTSGGDRIKFKLPDAPLDKGYNGIGKIEYDECNACYLINEIRNKKECWDFHHFHDDLTLKIIGSQFEVENE